MTMNKKVCNNLTKVTEAVAASTVGIWFPFCTVILHQPKLPKKLKKELEYKDRAAL